MGHDAEAGMDDREGSTKSYSPSQNKVNNEGENNMIIRILIRKLDAWAGFGT